MPVVIVSGGRQVRRRAPTAEAGNDERLRMLTTLLDDSPDAIVVADRKAVIQEWNPAAERLLGWTRAEILGAPAQRYVPADVLASYADVWGDLTTGTSVAPFASVRLHRDGSRRPVLVRVVAIHAHGSFAGAIATLRDARRAAPGERTLSGGRRGVQEALARPVPADLSRGVAVFDLDGFALVNDSYGADIGDDVLAELDQRLLTAVSGAGVVGRWQADEFVLVLDAGDPATELAELAAIVLAAVRLPVTVAGDRVYLTASAGLASGEVAGGTDLVRAAADALAAAKETGGDRAVWFTPALHTTPRADLRLAQDLRQGIGADQLRLHYQPIVDLTADQPVGVEALVRWERPAWGLLWPAGFIDVAERTGQIVRLGEWVTQQACRTAVELAALENGPQRVNINLSARQLADPGLLPMLRQALLTSGCPASGIAVEVTETGLMHNLAAATATLVAIKELGISLDLDDFGTGYSSLLYLKEFPVDRIKIDQSFVQGLGTNSDATAIVASTISLAHSVGVQAVAEGVETVDQLTLLRAMGCDFAQGYLFSRPLTMPQLRQWLARRPAAPQRRVRSSPPREPATDRVLRLHAEGASLNTIAASLNREGLRTARGSRWTATSVARTITRSQFPSLELD